MGGISRRDTFSLGLQRFLAWLTLPLIASGVHFYFSVIRRHRVHDRARVRRVYRELLKDRRPTLICPNHLTMFDSIYLHCALASPWRLFWSHRYYTWNLPAAENFKSTFFLSTLTYLSKCIPVDREGSAEHRNHILAQVGYLLRQGETFTIFPEGGRSRSGRIEPENVTYGIGHILKEFSDARVICVYCRGDEQRSYSDLARRGDIFYIELEGLNISTSHKGLRGVRDIAGQVIGKLKQMEDVYFQKHPAVREGDDARQ